MIILRRLLVLPLALLLLALLFVALAFQRVSSTALNPDFYKDELRRADVYRFLMTDVLTSALDEARKRPLVSGGVSQDNLLVDLGIETGEVVSAVNTAFPPEWLQAQVESGLDGVVPYVTGATEGFEAAIEVNGGISTLVAQAKPLLRDSNAYELFMQRVVDPAVDGVIRKGLPLGIKISPERARSGARRAVPPEWAHGQADAAIDQVSAYLLGERQSFAIAVPLDDRAQLALGEIKTLLRETDAYGTLYRDVLEPQVLEAVGRNVDLPIGIGLSGDEILAALRQVVPPSWVQTQTEKIIDDATPYLTGKTEGFASTVSLADNKAQAKNVIEELATKKLVERLNQLPTCRDDTTLRRLLSEGFTRVPDCLPREFHGAEIPGVVRTEIGRAVERFALASIPDSVTFTHLDLREALVQTKAVKSVEQLDSLRNTIRAGLSYTDADLRANLAQWSGDSGNLVKLLDEGRAIAADGWTYTHVDLRNALVDSGRVKSPEDFERARSNLRLIRGLPGLLFIVIGVILVAIGFLGGRDWPSRVAWASGALTLAAAAVYLFSGPIYDAVARPRVMEAVDNALAGASAAGDFPVTRSLIVEKAREIVMSAHDSAVSGLASSSILFIVVGLLAFVISIGLMLLAQTSRRP